jgi:hypothetical protein
MTHSLHPTNQNHLKKTLASWRVTLGMTLNPRKQNTYASPITRQCLAKYSPIGETTKRSHWICPPALPSTGSSPTPGRSTASSPGVRPHFGPNQERLRALQTTQSSTSKNCLASKLESANGVLPYAATIKEYQNIHFQLT